VKLGTSISRMSSFIDGNSWFCSTGCGKKYPRSFLRSILRIRLEFQSEILPSHLVVLCACNSRIGIW